MQKIKELYLKYKEIINYLIVGVATTIVSLAIYYGLTLTVLDANNPIQLQVANVISWIGAVAFAYFTNKIFVFKRRTERSKPVCTCPPFGVIPGYVFHVPYGYCFPHERQDCKTD